MTQEHIAALDRVLALVVLLNQDMTASLARDGLTASRVRVLWELHQRGPITQRALAEALGVAPRTVTGLVDGLVTTGFVTREPHPADRRAILVTFSEHGARTIAAMAQAQREFAELLFADIPDKQLTTFVATLDHILARLSEQGLSHEIEETA